MKWIPITEQILFLHSSDKELLSRLHPYYDKLAVKCEWDEIPKSLTFPFVKDHTVFGLPKPEYQDNGFPIWKELEDMVSNSIIYGCVNHHSVTFVKECFCKSFYKQIDGLWHSCSHIDNKTELAKKFKIFY